MYFRNLLHEQGNFATISFGDRMNVVELIEKEQIKDTIPDFRIGDTIKVHFRIVEGSSERVQAFEGLVIAKNNSGVRKTVTVRKISFRVGVERIFPVHSPRLQNIEIVRRGKIRRSKLYYIRERVGKATKVKEKIVRNK